MGRGGGQNVLNATGVRNPPRKLYGSSGKSESDCQTDSHPRHPARSPTSPSRQHRKEFISGAPESSNSPPSLIFGDLTRRSGTGDSQRESLSLEVTFVIADVVTPLLGLDTILKDSLILHVGQNLEHFLVNPVGGRTKLEHMGKHLYLIACPSQHGSSSFFLGDLSQVIGFLLADKALQAQKSTSKSSSSLDLEEEAPKQQVEQDSLNLQCHPVLQETSDEDGDPSFDLAPGKEEVADTGESLKQQAFIPSIFGSQNNPQSKKGSFTT